MKLRDAAVPAPDPWYRPDAAVERRLAAWKPDARNEAVPPAHLRVVVDDLCGRWESDRFFDHADLTFTPTGHGIYRVHVQAHLCNSYWAHERTATYRDGVVTLDRPIDDSWDRYRKLYTVRLDGQIRLVSAASVGSAAERSRLGPIPKPKRGARDGMPEELRRALNDPMRRLRDTAFTPPKRTLHATPWSPATAPRIRLW